MGTQAASSTATVQQGVQFYCTRHVMTTHTQLLSVRTGKTNRSFAAALRALHLPLTCLSRQGNTVAHYRQYIPEPVADNAYHLLGCKQLHPALQVSCQGLRAMLEVRSCTYQDAGCTGPVACWVHHLGGQTMCDRSDWQCWGYMCPHACCLLCHCAKHESHPSHSSTVSG